MNVIVKSMIAADCLPRRLTYETPEGTTVRELIDTLSREYGEDVRACLLAGGEIAEGSLIMLNGVSLRQPDMSLDSVMKEGDSLLFAAMVYGG